MFVALTVALLLSLSSGFAQVRIGQVTAPDYHAILDMRHNLSAAKGVLLPTVTLTSLTSPLPFNTGTNPLVDGTTVYHNGGNNITKGIYIWDATASLWKTTIYGTNWFFMPPDTLKTDVGHYSFDLFLSYSTNVANAHTSGTPSQNLASTGAPAFTTYETVPPDGSYFYYYILGRDPDVFTNITISNMGVMEYDVPANAIADDKTFITIVFVRK
jgi:hypothetical protein